MSNSTLKWFKNIKTYFLKKESSLFSLKEEELNKLLSDCSFRPCDETSLSSFGWQQPIINKSSNQSPLYYHRLGNFIYLTARRDEKILPSSVIKQFLDERIELAEEKENRKLKKVEKQSIKDQVVSELLKQAFTRSTYHSLVIDLKNELIYVDSASEKRAEDLLSLLRKTLGSLPVVPVFFSGVNDKSPSQILKDMLINQDDLLGDHFVLRSPENNGSIVLKEQDTSKEDLQSVIEDNELTSASFSLEEGDFKFRLDLEKTIIKQISWGDVFKIQNEDIPKEDFAQRFDSDLLLMCEQIVKTHEELINTIGELKKPVD